MPILCRRPSREYEGADPSDGEGMFARLWGATGRLAELLAGANAATSRVGDDQLVEVGGETKAILSTAKNLEALMVPR